MKDKLPSTIRFVRKDYAKTRGTPGNEKKEALYDPHQPAPAEHQRKAAVFASVFITPGMFDFFKAPRMPGYVQYEEYLQALKMVLSSFDT